MDRLVQLRGEPGGSRDSTLDSTASPSEAYITANESSKYFSLTEEDSSFDISPIKDVSLASSAVADKTITGNDELITNLSPIPKKNDLLDSYKLGKQIEAANILSGGVDIFDDNDNSYDGDELVIDDNVVEIDDKSNPEMKLMEGTAIPFQKSEDMTDSMDSEAPVASKDTEVMLQIDGKNVNAIDIGNGLYLYRKEGEEELAAVQIAVDDPQQPSFKFLKVRENAEGNLEVYEEIEIEVPKAGPSQLKTVEKSASHVPIKDINKVINDPTGTKSVERKKPLQKEKAPPTSSNETEPAGKVVPPETKSEINLFGKAMKLNETRKSPVIHSTPNKEGIPLTKTMVDLQLHPNRHLDKVKTIEVHTDGSNKRPSDSQTKNKDDDKLEHDTCKIEKPDTVTENKEDNTKKLDDMQHEKVELKDNQNTEKHDVEITDTVEAPKDSNTVEVVEKSKKVEATQKSEEKAADIGITEKATSASINIKENIDNKIKENGKINMNENANQLYDKLSDGAICVKDDNSNITPTKDKPPTKPCLEVNKPEIHQLPSTQEASKIENKTEIKNVFSLKQTASNLPEEKVSLKGNTIEVDKIQVETKDVAENSKINTDLSDVCRKDLGKNLKGTSQSDKTQMPIDIVGTALSEPAKKIENRKADNLREHLQDTQSNLEVLKSNVPAGNNQSEKGEMVKENFKVKEKQSNIESVEKPKQNITKNEEKTNKNENKITKDYEKPISKVPENFSQIIFGQDTVAEINKGVPERPVQSMLKDQDEIINKEVTEKITQNVLGKQEDLKNTDVSEKTSQNTSKNLDKQIDKEVSEKGTQIVLKTQDQHLNTSILEKSAQNIPIDKQVPVEASVKGTQNILKDIDKQKSKEASEKVAQHFSHHLKQNKQEVIEKSVQNILIEPINQNNKEVTISLLTRKEDAKQPILCKKEVIKDQKDKAIDNVKINEPAVTISSQAKPDIKRETSNIEQQPIKISNIAVPFGKWTEANRQEFLNKIKETKIPTMSSNTKSLKQANDLNRRDVLQKIDSQRQSACNALSLKTQEATKLNIKNEAPTFINKPTASRETKVHVKAESQVLKNKPPAPKPTVKPEIAQTSKKLPPKATVTTLNVNKQDVSQRKEINNQDLIDKTIEGIINRAVTTTHKESSVPKEVIKQKMETISVDNIKPKENQSSALDAIESKMNELHGIPFIERPPHELPKVYHRDIKTYSKTDKKIPVNKANKKPNVVPFVQKTTQDTIIDLDSEEEVIEHEPITGDINLKPKNVGPKLLALPSNANVAVQRNIDASKKETIITEKDFEQFARRNSITYENHLTVNFEGNKQHNVTQSVVAKDTNTKVAKNEIVHFDSKAVTPPKQKPITVSNPMNTIQFTSKVVPVSEENYQTKLQLAYQTALTTKRQMESPITIIEDKPVKVVFLDSNAAFPQNQLCMQGRDLSPTKKPILDNESVTNSGGDSLDSDVLDSVDDTRTHDETRVKIKHQRKQVLTPVETPELELIVPRDLAIDESPKKKRKFEDSKLDKNSKAMVPKKSYLFGRSTVAEDSMRQQDLSKNTLKETANQNNAVVSHKDTASAIDNLVKAAELIETQSETLKANPVVVHTDNSPQVTTVKRGRGRPRKYPLTEGTPAKTNASSPQKKPRLIDAKQKKDSITTDEDDTDDDDIMIRENWTMGKINEKIVCPICNKLFRSENVVFKHVKHCTGPSPNRSDSDKRSTRRSRPRDSDSKSASSKYDDMDIDSEDSAPKKGTPKKRKSKEKSSDGKEDVILIEDTPIKEKAEIRDQAKSQEPKKVTKTKAQYKTSVLSCEHCGKTFRQLSYLVNHKLLHKKETANKQAETNAQVGDKSVFSCEVCKKEFRKLHHLVQHRLIHNQNNAPSRPSRKTSHEQSVDDKGTKDQDSKQNEDLIAAFRCEQCGKSFRKLHHLVEHRETHACINKQKSGSVAQASDEKGTPAPPYICDVCKKTFRKLHHLIEHREQHVETSSDKSDDKSVKSSLSTRDIIHECPLCYMVFPNEQALNKHAINCQRKKKQSAAKQAKQLEENKDNVTEKSETDKERATEVEPEPAPAVKNTEQVTPDKLDDKSVPVVEKQVQETPDKEALSSKDGIKHPEQITSSPKPSKRDSEESMSSTAEGTEHTPKIPPHKIKKVEPKSDDDLPLKVITAAKKKIFAKDKGSPPVVKKDKPNIATVNVSETAPVESSDDDEIRYMLNPDYIEENFKGKVFMKVKARKRNSLQIERPNSKDLVKRRTSLQHPPKIPRLKAKLTEKSDITANPQVNTSRNTKLEPVPSTDSDDSDVKYSFPENPPQSSEPEKTPKEKRKPIAEKRKTLVGIARRKSLGKSVTAKHKEKSPVKEIKRRRAEVEHRCDCGKLFLSAALLARHTSLDHTPPRVRRRRLNDEPAPPAARKSAPAAAAPAPAPPAARKSAPAAAAPAPAPPAARKSATAARKSAPAGKPKSTDSRKSSVRSDDKAPPPKAAGRPGRPAGTTPPRPAPRRSVRPERAASPKLVSVQKSRKSAAHRGVPVPEKMKKIVDKLRK